MVAKKVAPAGEGREVVYGQGRWGTLRRLRGVAAAYLGALEGAGIGAIVHGSVARGDVTERSDVDVFVPEVCPSYAIEEAVGRVERASKRELTQATPAHTLKAILHLSDVVKVTFPLLPLRGRERDFYRFGGELGLDGLVGGRRVPGVDKRLMVISPTAYGHLEFSALASPSEASRALGVGLETMEERIRVLTRRDKVGRTGVYYKEELGDDETFEGKLRETASSDPSLRRLLQQRGMEFKY